MRIKAITKKFGEIVVWLLLTSFVFATLGININFETAYGESFSSTQLYSSYQAETISFTKREIESSKTASNVPTYFQLSELDNSCGAVAGAIIIGFYDRYFEELIPNYSSYLAVIDRYKGNDNTYIPALMQELYTLMRINVDDLGVSMQDCMNGLGQYVRSKNRTFGYSSVKTSNAINENSYVASINANKPVILFNTSTELYKISNTSSKDTLVVSTVANNHVYVGYGYVKIKYYNSSGNFRTDTYMQVATGFSGLSSGYIRIGSTATTVSHDWSIYGYSVSIS